MKYFKQIPIQLTLITCLLIYLSSSNGQTQKYFTSKETNNPSLTAQLNNVNASVHSIDKNIRSIFQDNQGTYWFGTNGAVVYRYDNKTLTQYTVKDGLADNQVIYIQEDDLGNLWFESGNFAISKFNGKTFTPQTDKANITNGSIAHWKSKSNNLWFYAGGGVFRYSNLSFDQLHNQRRSNKQRNKYYL